MACIFFMQNWKNRQRLRELILFIWRKLNRWMVRWDLLPRGLAISTHTYTRGKFEKPISKWSIKSTKLNRFAGKSAKIDGLPWMAASQTTGLSYYQRWVIPYWSLKCKFWVCRGRNCDEIRKWIFVWRKFDRRVAYLWLFSVIKVLLNFRIGNTIVS